MRLFNGTIEKGILVDVLSFIGSYVSEVRVKINDEGMTFCFVNPENTVASYVVIPWNCWDYFMVEEELEIGIDVRRILEILPILGDLIEVIVEKDYKLDGRTFELAFLLKCENIAYIIAVIDPEWMRKCMPRETFENIKDAAEDGTKIVLEHKLFKDLMKTAKQDYLYLESHDEEIIVYNGYRELEPLEFTGVVFEPSIALYKIEYLKPLANLKTSAELEIYFATKKPCYITTELKCATLEMVIAPYIPTEEKDWEVYAPKRIEYDHIITIDIPKDLARAIKHIKPNAVYINKDNNEIYFVNYISRVRWKSYVVLKDIRGLGGMQGFYDCVSNLAEFISEEIMIGTVGDKLYINDVEVGSKVAEDFKLYKPTLSYNEISIPLKDFKNLIRACGGETGRFAIVGDGECLRLVAVTPEEETVFSHCLFSPYEEKKVIRVPYIWTLPSGVGDIVNIYYQGELGSPIIFEYVRRKRKGEIPLFYYNATPHPEAEKEHIEELEEIIFGVKVEEEKPPEKPPEEKRELPHDIQSKLSEAKGFVRQTQSYLQDLSQIYKKELVKVFDRLYDTFREVETLVETAPSKEALKMLDELQNEFLDLEKRICLIRTKIADYDKERLGLEIRLKPFEWHGDVMGVLTELSDIAHELRKWDSRLEDLTERIREYVEKIQELKRKTKKAIVMLPKRTPPLEDILAELEPLGYRERWKVVESLKAKGFEDVEETIDRFIKEGKLRKVGKYIEAVGEVWTKYKKVPFEEVVEKVKKALIDACVTPEEIAEIEGFSIEDVKKAIEQLKPKKIPLVGCYTLGDIPSREEVIEAVRIVTEKSRSGWVTKGEVNEELVRKGYKPLIASRMVAELIEEGVLEAKEEYWPEIGEVLLVRLKEKPEVKEEKTEKVGKPHAEEKPKEEKPPAKPSAEPYDFILEKLKSTFLAELELAGLSEEEAERELEAILFEIEKMARDVVEGKLSQVDAVKEVIKKARTITRPTEVAPPEEVRIVKEEKPRRIGQAKEIWKGRRAEYAPPTEVTPPTEATEMAMSIKDVMESLGWKGVVELLKPHLPEIFAYGIENFLKRHREWSLAISPVKRNIEAIFRNLRRLIEQQASEKYSRGELSFREWLIGGAPEKIRLPLLAMLLYYGYTSDAFKKELREVYENPEIQNALKKYGITSFNEFYNAMVEFLRQYRL